MNSIIAFILFFIPHPFNTFLRNLFGAKVSKSAKISIFSLIMTRDLEVGEGVVISSFTLLKANQIKLGKFSHIAPMVIINAPLIKGANFFLGENSRVFPFCWLEPGEGIYIGNHVGVGGHTLIFTHGSWSNYFHGGPVSFAPVKIEDHVWLPWRVFILPGVTIGKYSIIGANSTVTSSIPPHSLAGGTPAKVIKANINGELSEEELNLRISNVFNEYEKYAARADYKFLLKREDVHFYKSSSRNKEMHKCLLAINIETLTYQNDNNDEKVQFFISFLRRFGIRLTKENVCV